MEKKSKELKEAQEFEIGAGKLPNIYKTTFHCRNCGEVLILSVPKRTRVNDFIQARRCPNCECKLI